MYRLVSIVGARPQFIKAAVISRLIKSDYTNSIDECLVHSGQHYDDNMSDVFFRELNIPLPDVNLSVGSGSHGKTTGVMLEKIERLLQSKQPDCVLVYGDTNTTLAGALAASKLNIPIAHIEAGLRSFNKSMPEEQNRVLTDHLATYLFCPTDVAVENLEKEGIKVGVYRTGDIMYDASLYYRSLPHEPSVEIPKDYYLITIHRAENTDNRKRLKSIVDALNSFTELQGILPLHPRTKKMLDQYGLRFEEHIKLIDPIGYLDMINLENKCRFIVTDSGGVQKEAYFFNKPCITLREETEWVETLDAGANTLVGYNKERILPALKNPPAPQIWKDLYGDGNSSLKIINTLLSKS